MIPAITVEALQRYLEHGINPGSGLTAVLEGNLFGAFSTLDEENIRSLREIVEVIGSKFPGDSYGSRFNVENWKKDPGLRAVCTTTNKAVQHLGQMLHGVSPF
jgi:hypothetical protein